MSSHNLTFFGHFLQGPATTYSFFFFLPFPTVIPEPVGCQSDEECSRNEACNFGSCVNPCVTDNPCSPRAQCFVENHRAQCKCPPGFTGDPFRDCTQSKSAKYLCCTLPFGLDIKTLLSILKSVLENVSMMTSVQMTRPA